MNLRYGLYPTPPVCPRGDAGRSRPAATVASVRRAWIPGAVAVVVAVAVVAAAHTAHAQEDEPPPPTTVPPDETVLPDEQGDVTGGDDATPDTLPLIPVPIGCAAPPMPHIVFVGEVVDRDYRTVRFEIERVRSGRRKPFASDGRIDVRYGIDAQYLEDGSSYLVSAVVEPDLGLLVSRVTDPIENFGGDEVIGVSETDVACPDFEDPARTLGLDGTLVESSVLEPFLAARVRILGAFVIPLAIALGVIFVLAMFRLSVSGLYRSVVDGGRRGG